MSIGTETAGTGQRVSVPDAATFFKAKIEIALNRVMWTCLSNVEAVAAQHAEAMGKLMDELPAEHRAKVYLADHFGTGTARFDAIRSAVLKVGNDARRELHDTVDFLRL